MSPCKSILSGMTLVGWCLCLGCGFATMGGTFEPPDLDPKTLAVLKEQPPVDGGFVEVTRIIAAGTDVPVYDNAEHPDAGKFRLPPGEYAISWWAPRGGPYPGGTMSEGCREGPVSGTIELELEPGHHYKLRVSGCERFRAWIEGRVPGEDELPETFFWPDDR